MYYADSKKLLIFGLRNAVQRIFIVDHKNSKANPKTILGSRKLGMCGRVFSTSVRFSVRFCKKPRFSVRFGFHRKLRPESAGTGWIRPEIRPESAGSGQRSGWNRLDSAGDPAEIGRTRPEPFNHGIRNFGLDLLASVRFGSGL